MGLFSKAIDARIEQILLNHFGFHIKPDFIVGGYLDVLHLQISRMAFTAAVNSDGVFFIHEGRVLFAITWDRILMCEPNLVNTKSDLILQMSANSMTAPRREYPFNEWFDAEINFKTAENQSKFTQEFFSQKSKQGFTVETLMTHDKWLSYRVALPVNLKRYLEVNSHWGTEESRLESYKVWGLSQDAQRFLLYVGRASCTGTVPGNLLDLAKAHWMEIEELNSKFTNNKLSVSNELESLISKTKSISSGFKHEGVWTYGFLQIGEEEWVSEIPTTERLVAINWDHTSGYLQQAQVWSDFRKGTQITIISQIGDVKNGKIVLNTSHGLLTLNERGRKDLQEMLPLLI